MIVSQGEIEAAVLKGTRGAGHAWGVAEEAGKAARWLAARRLPCLEMIVPLLEAGPAEVCPLAIGTGLADLPREAVSQARTIAGVAAPLLLLPFLAWVAKATATAVSVTWPGVRVRLDAKGEIADLAAEAGALARSPVTVTIGPAAAPPGFGAIGVTRGGVAVDDGLWTRLDALVVLTYVPESEESRRRGAGAVALEEDRA